MNQQYFDYLKAKARSLLRGSFNGDRQRLVSEIKRRFDAENTPTNERGFMASFYMSQMGYGGGI